MVDFSKDTSTPLSQTLTGNPDLDAYLLMQQRQPQNASAPSPAVAPPPPDSSQSTPSFDVNALMAPFQAQAEKLYGGNPVFGHSAFASNHPRLADALSNALVSASHWRTGPTTGDNIGNAAQMALAPEELAHQRAIQKAQYPAAMIGPQLEMALKGSEIQKNQAMSALYGGAYANRANAQAANQLAGAAQKPITSQQGQEKIDQHKADMTQHEQDFLASDATKRYLAQQRAKIEFDKEHDPTGARVLGDKLKYMQAWQHESDNINLKWDATIQSYRQHGTMGAGGIPDPATQQLIDQAEASRQQALDNHDIEGSATVKELFPGKYKSIYDYRDSVHQDLLNHQSKNVDQTIPDGKGQSLDPATAQTILKAAGGNKHKARQIAKSHNWKF